MLANYSYEINNTLYEDINDEITVFTGTQQRFDDVFIIIKFLSLLYSY